MSLGGSFRMRKIGEMKLKQRAESQALCILAQRYSKEYDAILSKREEILKRMEEKEK